MLIGLEKEMFVKNAEGKVILVPKDIPKDDCGYLAEARGLPFNNIAEAVYSLKASEHKIIHAATTAKLHIDDSPILKVSKDVRLEARRLYSKGIIAYRNLYNYKDHKHSSNECPAGVHISFTNPVNALADGKVIRTVNALFDFVSIFKALDSAFKSEIKAAKRNPGFYEIKSDNRIEYRSLPSNVNLSKVINVVNEALKGL